MNTSEFLKLIDDGDRVRIAKQYWPIEVIVEGKFAATIQDVKLPDRLIGKTVTGLNFDNEIQMN
ncbi:hypothetical protein ACFL17_04260 [Pseudomonadota bacterium]